MGKSMPCTEPLIAFIATSKARAREFEPFNLWIRHDVANRVGVCRLAGSKSAVESN